MKKSIKILSTNISEKKGVVKLPVNKIELMNKGIKNDAHAGLWHRQVSLLDVESIRKFEKSANRKINFGEFAENLSTEGIELYHLQIGDIFYNEDVKLEVTQIGKECHGTSCAIFKEVGACVIPKEGIFCRVLKNGSLQKGDTLYLKPKLYQIEVITLSNRAYQGEYEDRSGKILIEQIEKHFDTLGWPYQVNYHLIPDKASALENILQQADENKSAFVFTTGGTGVGEQDITVNVVDSLLDVEIPGIMDMIRLKYGKNNPKALLSRSIAGRMNKTFVFTLPGSTKAIQEYTTEIFQHLEHLVYMLMQIDRH